MNNCITVEGTGIGTCIGCRYSLPTANLYIGIGIICTLSMQCEVGTMVWSLILVGTLILGGLLFVKRENHDIPLNPYALPTQYATNDIKN